jgi:peptide/nickel transport system substrate-binding protein
VTPPAEPARDRTWRTGVAVGFVGLGAITFVNTCALDDLEARVARIEAASQPVTVPPLRPDRVPGTATGWRPRGFGGAEADMLFVEGVSPETWLGPHPPGGTLRLRDAAAPRSLSPFATDAAADRVLQRVLGRLVSLDPDHPREVVPSLATEWRSSDDNLTTTWHLRRGVQFADGRELTSDDVVYSFDVLRDPGVDAADLRRRIDFVAEVAATDPWTVVVRVAEPSWRDALKFGYHLPVLNRAWFEAELPRAAARAGLSTAEGLEPGTPGFAEAFNAIRVPGPGTGPYMLDATEFDTSDGITLVRNPFAMHLALWPELHNVDQVHFTYVSDEGTALDMLRAGAIDIVHVDPATWDDGLRDDTALLAVAQHVAFEPFLALASSVVYNHRRPPFDDVAVRNAFARLVDRDWLLREVDRSRGRVAAGPFNPSFPEYPNHVPPLSFDLSPAPFAPDEAAAQLDAAGWLDHDGDATRDRNGVPLRVELIWGGTRPFWRQLGASMRAAGAEIGVDIQLQELDAATFETRFAQRDFDAAAVVETTPDPWFDPIDWYHSREDAPGGRNASGWHDPTADALMERLHGSMVYGERLLAWRDVHERIRDQQPVTFLLHETACVLVSRRLQGARAAPIGFVDDGVWIP